MPSARYGGSGYKEERKYMSESLLIFVKNPELGKVKTRLAAGIGDVKALEIYELLLKRTHEITANLPLVKYVFYSESKVEDDLWSKGGFIKKRQKGDGLGERMHKAMYKVFKKQKADKVVIIGSDCYQLTEDIISEAFRQLDDHEVVIGPSTDGGYYLLGMKSFFPELLENIPWSTSEVAEMTINKAEKLDLRVFQLPALTDVDEEKDLVTIEALSSDTAA
jgi:uncharacterized protein